MRRFLLLAGLALVALAGCTPSDGASPDRVEIRIEHSAFAPEDMAFEPGDTVTFVIRNTDPIDHEFILGDEAVQAKHEEGKERTITARCPERCRCLRERRARPPTVSSRRER